MSQMHYFTDEEKAELLINPFTARVSDCRVFFNLAFKQFVMENIDKPNMTSTKVFKLAGYRTELFSSDIMRRTVRIIRNEASSKEGLQEAKEVKKYTPRKKYSETEFRELQQRVVLLEQQVDFLKKSQALKRKNHSKPPTSSD